MRGSNLELFKKIIIIQREYGLTEKECEKLLMEGVYGKDNEEKNNR